MAEEGGFEPPASCPAAVFKTAALNRSTTPPEILHVLDDDQRLIVRLIHFVTADLFEHQIDRVPRRFPVVY